MADPRDHARLVPFAFDGHEIRTLTGADGEPWFVASDVAKVLGYAQPDKAVRDHCKAARNTRLNQPGNQRGNPNVTIIPERDVYRLILRSKLPAAERFEDWVVGTVLPTIRRTGSYGQLDTAAVQQSAAAAAVAAIRQMLPDLVAAELTRDPRRGVGEYSTALEVALREHAPQTGRRALSLKISNRLTRFSIQHGYPMRNSPETGRRMFHRDAVDAWLRQDGRALIQAHVDRLQGQGRLKLVPR